MMTMNKENIRKLLVKSLMLSLVLVLVITVLGSLGVDISGLLTGLGLTGFAVGFALKDTLSNLVSGLMVLLYQPFKIGQYISVSGHSGKVCSVDLRYTTLDSNRNKILIPNTTIFTKEVIVSDNPI